MTLFYLGTHMPHWLWDSTVPLFVSHRRLAQRRTYKQAACRWALDSGGFTELSLFGEWRTTPSEYVTAVRRYASEIGRMDWAAPQDAMCEPWVLAHSKIGGTVEAHQKWTVSNLLTLRSLAPDLPFIPVLQGWQLDDYRRCADLYETAGIDLTVEPVVGLGSVCRRQATADIGAIAAALAPLKLHGFGVKKAGLKRYGNHLTSADSLAWSYSGRTQRPCPHTGVASCANCRPYALAWRTVTTDTLL